MTDIIQGIIDKFQNYDLNEDGDPAINSLYYPSFEQVEDTIPKDARLLLVLIEPHLIDPLPGSEDLVPRLKRFKDDLWAEGLNSRFICASLYNGQRHQDGRTLLALRKFLQEIKKLYINFVGIVLVGEFPEATLVRRCIWAPNFPDVEIGGIKTKGERYLAIEPEFIASRAEIVLADLDGNWPILYKEELEEIESIRALPDTGTESSDWPADNAIFSSTKFTIENIKYRDFFLIDDSDYTASVSASAKVLQILIRLQQANPEVGIKDCKSVNPIAKPDILISRINAQDVAMNPDPSIKGEDGKKPLNAAGYPQFFVSSKDVPLGIDMFRSDPILERRLLCEYFDRNHNFRIGGFADLPFRAGAIAAKGLSAEWNANYLATASKDFQAPLVKDEATLIDYVKWFKEPAVLRIIDSHSNETATYFDGSYDILDLEQVVGGLPFRWHRDGNRYLPSLRDQGYWADWYLHRTIWQNRILSNVGAHFIIHLGCHAMSVSGTLNVPYYKEGYAPFQNAESILFFMNGLAILARSKIFNDVPTGFPKALGLSAQARFGDGWKSFFENDANDSNLLTPQSGYGISAKKAYFWSMLGDWTLRLRYHQANPFLNSNVMKWMEKNGFKDDEKGMRAWTSQHYIQFWDEMAKTYADWFEPWSSTLVWNPPYARWFVGGKCNVAYNCVDRHAQGAKKDKVAYIFVPEPVDQPTQKITYAMLEKEVNKFANGLKSLGVQKGDRVMLYMPMIPQLPIAMLAVAKIGAIHCSVFSGFSSGGLNSRIMDAEAKVVVTVDGFYRRGKPLALKPNVDEATANTPSVQKVVVYKRTGVEVPMKQGKDIWWDDLVAGKSDKCECEKMDSEDRLFILYTSGTTGKPKGIEHVHGGYCVTPAQTLSWIFDINEDDVWWCTADIGWITGHSYVVYGPLCLGATSILCEGSLDYPDLGRWFNLIQDNKVSKFYTAPTAIRMFMKAGEQWPKKYNISSLKILGSVGEPITLESWNWYKKFFGSDRCPIMDTWWDTESGCILISPLPITLLKPGSPTLPLPGFNIDILDENGNSAPPGFGGDIVSDKPWPSMLRAFYRDPERYWREYWSKYGAIRPGTFMFGDKAKKDDDGYFFIQGRIAK